jgi:YHS domain-containing protein
MWLTRPDPAAAAPGRPVPALAVLCLAALLAAPGLAVAAAPGSETTRIELLTLNGFDPVTYFLEGGPQAGTARFELTWGGHVWRFASGANREAFRDDPAVYAPRLGGFDAAGILEGRLVDADPLVFAVIAERLYLFRDAGRRARFVAEPSLAERAEAAWPGLRGLLDMPARDAPPR